MRPVQIGRGEMTVFASGTALVDLGDGPIRVADWRAGIEELTGHSIDLLGPVGPGRARHGAAGLGLAWQGREHH